MVREKGSSLRGRKTPSPQEQLQGEVLGRGDDGDFHITWGPVSSLSSMFPSAGKRESQGADNALSFTAWGSLLGLGPSSSCSLGPGLRSVSIGSSLKLGDSRAVSRGKVSSKSTSVPRLWFVTWEPTHITHHHNRARKEGNLVQNSEGKSSTEKHC